MVTHQNPAVPTMQLSPTVASSVLITEKLLHRPYRGPNYELENRALVALMQALATDPRNVLQVLVEKAMELCRAGSAGISIAEGETAEAVFRWHAVVGEWAAYTGGTLPRWHSPCATVLDRNCPLLMTHLELAYAIPDEVQPKVNEVLLVPFYTAANPGCAVGTVWVLSHSPSTVFDREDLRLLESLAAFAGAAYQTLTTTRPAA